MAVRLGVAPTGIVASSCCATTGAAKACTSVNSKILYAEMILETGFNLIRPTP
jgi:hypothetical protein